MAGFSAAAPMRVPFQTPLFLGKKELDVDDGHSSYGTESTADASDSALFPTSEDEAPSSRAVTPPTNGLLSAGSVLHGIGECEPCAWFWKPQGCQHGQACFRCHLCPSGEIKARKAAKLNSRRAICREERQQEGQSDLLFGLRVSSSDIAVAGEYLAEGAAPTAVVAPPRPAIVHPRPAAEMPSSAELLRHFGPPPGLVPPPPPPPGLGGLAPTAAAAPQRQRPAPPVAVGASLGSLMHGTGNCEPCAWFWKPQGCQNGANCSRCHLCPKGEVKARKGLKKAAMRSAVTSRA